MSRLLKQAELDGIVRTTVVVPAGVQTALEEGPEERYGLREAVVVELLDAREALATDRFVKEALDGLTSAAGAFRDVVIARWLERGPKVIILDEPTRGIDMGARAAIYEVIADLARGGMAVIVVSSELAVNAAGIASATAAEDMPLEQFKKVLDVNLNGVFLCCQAEGRSLLANGGGAIVNIASMSGSIVNRDLQQGALQRVQGGGDPPQQVAGDGVGAARDPREPALPGLHRHAHEHPPWT